MMAQMGIHNPDELPAQFRTKPHVFKKKVGEPNGKPPPIRPALAGNNGSPSPPDQAYDYQQYGSTTSHGSPTFSQPSYGTPSSPAVVNNPSRGQTLDPALFNNYSGHRGASCSSSGRPPCHTADSREENMFELYTKEPSSGPGASGYESNATPALGTATTESLESMDQFLQHDR
jgi:histone demethylase JARID1